MKTNNINILSLILLLVIFLGCSKDNDIIQKMNNGPFVKFLNKNDILGEDDLPKRYTGDFGQWSFSAKIEAPANNVKSYKLYVSFDTTFVKNKKKVTEIRDTIPRATSVELTSFPATLSITGAEVMKILKKEDKDFHDGLKLWFYGEVTGNDGKIAKDFPGYPKSKKSNSNVASEFINWNVGTLSAYRFAIQVTNRRVSLSSAKSKLSHLKNQRKDTVKFTFNMKKLVKAPTIKVLSKTNDAGTISSLTLFKDEKKKIEYYYGIFTAGTAVTDSVSFELSQAEAVEGIAMKTKTVKKHFVIDNKNPTVLPLTRTSTEVIVIEKDSVSSVAIPLTFSENVQVDTVANTNPDKMLKYVIKSAKFDDVTIKVSPKKFKVVPTPKDFKAKKVVPKYITTLKFTPKKSKKKILLNQLYPFTIQVSGGEDIAGNPLSQNITVK